MKKIFLNNACIIDGTGAPAIERGTLVMEKPSSAKDKGKILFAGESKACPFVPETGDETADLSGYSVLPGLFDCHVHLWGSTQKPMFKADHLGVATRTMMCYRNVVDALLVGITTIRAVGGSDDIDISLRDAINRGYLWGSRLIACGSPIEPYGGHCHITWGTVECSGPDDFAKAARIQMGKGVDQIKLMYTGGASGGKEEGMFATHITDEEAAAVCRVAHMAGHRVAAHLSNDTAIRSALTAGVDSVEHGYSMNEDTAKMLVDKGAFYVPTIGTTGNAIDYPREGLSEQFQMSIERLIAAYPTHARSLEFAMKHGAKICVGTDALPAMPLNGSFATVREIMLLVRCGMSPIDAIKAGTSTGAELCGLEKQTGSLRAGLSADISVFKGRPDRNIGDLDNISMVAKEGRIIWSNVEGYLKPRCFELLPQDGASTEGLCPQW